MQTHELVQGSPQWLAHRSNFFNASDAPAMMGVSPYKSRADLVREYATGLGDDIDARTQSLFDRGHRAEELARPIAEKIIGQDLYPVVGTEGRLGASFDGLTMLEEVAFEHKMLNADLRAAMRQQGGSANECLPPHYLIQMEQQCMVAGCDRVLFLATAWTDDGVLSEERHCWYTADPKLAEQINRGWDQFEADVAAYQPSEAAPIVTAAAQEHLPALSVRLNGSLAVVSNLKPFGEALRAFVDRIPKKPSTDQEFADTEAACKRLKEAEDRLQSAEDSALASMGDVETMRRMVADFRDLARTTRLASEKLVKQRKEQIREEEVARGHGAMTEHIAALNRRIDPHTNYIAGLTAGNFGAAIKGLKSLDSVRDAIDTELARAKIEASALADKIDANLKAINAAGAPTLFPDTKALVLKESDDLAAVIAQRLAAEKKRQDDERERIRAEEQARADREARERAEKAERDERERVEREAAEQRAREAQQAASVVIVHPASTVAAELRGDGSPAPAGVPLIRGEIGQIDGAIRIVESAPADTRPPLKLGEVCDRLGFVMTAAFVTGTLGIASQPDPKGRAVLFAARDYDRICDALVKHIKAKAAEC